MRLFFLPLLLLFLLAARLAPAQTIQTEAAQAYWRLTDALRRDEPLTNAAWQQFLALPDNKVYVEAVWGSDTASVSRYRRAIEVVYRPRYDSLRQAKIKAGSWYYILVNHYKEQEADDRAFLALMAQNPTYLESMYTLAYEYLPARDHYKVQNLHLAYVALGNDATSQQAGIVFSIRDARDQLRLKPGILEAHEMHHRLRSTKDWHLVAADESLLTALYMTLNEGTADLIDKRVALEQQADTAEASQLRRWLLRPAPKVIHQLDSTICVQATGGPATSLRFYRGLTNGTNGHLPGFFMAYTILQNGLLQSLLAHANDPLAFALLYQQAAKKDQRHQHPPTFSPRAERYLRRLARQYAKSHPAAS
ncbi:DUF5700 domain-containing putative Zn-dependent protease [Hymenobacter sp. BT559]|uniref:DUF5700 domain-containing putative Zn-dependent protease n=1 Tax=Hymenobacter sp. BT559 TaxID=2795729 RepID=UPI0018ED6B4C|nr:DUF5700 domain-containing putative Zn-dependent protease [Hymenobacter sp. BT559]MBJ6146454.1 hypothetical protein [Hymenobacter sp. BT559]